jgi:hypothetical protein
MFFALDTPDDEEPLRTASAMLREAGFTRQAMRVYCLIGFPRDTFSEAESRLRLCLELGFFPMAMLWRDKDGLVDPTWARFQRGWARPAIIAAKNAPQDTMEVCKTAYNMPMVFADAHVKHTSP